MYSSIYREKEINSSLKRIQKNIKNILEAKKLLKKSEELSLRRQLTSKNHFSDGLDRAIFQIMLTHALELERQLPGGFESFFTTMCRGHKELFPILLKNRRISRSELFAEMDVVLSNDRQKSLLKCALDLAGFGGKIFIERCAGSIASVERTSGFTFEASCPIVREKISLDNPAVFLLDAYVESVAELHVLLEDCHAAGKNVVLFIRGCHEDLLQTLKVNVDRGTLKVYPVVCKFDVFGINTLADVAAVVGADVVSSHKGELLSSLRLDVAKFFPRIYLEKYQVTLMGRPSPRHETHLRGLIDKRNSADPELQELTNRRIKSLSEGKVVIRLPDDHNLKSDTEALDGALRLVSHLFSRGIHESRDAAVNAAASRCLVMIEDVKCAINLQ